MAKYLVDTTVLINHLRGKTAARDFLAEKRELRISCVSLAELFQGARNKKELLQIKKLVSLLAVEWGSARINQRAVEIIEKNYLKFGITFFDSLIAATAIENNLELVTDNLKHFRPIIGLTVKRLGEV